MASPTSGFVTWRRNLTDKDSDSDLLSKNLTVPLGHAIMISFKELVANWKYVKLYTFANNGDKTLVWYRHDAKTDFAHVYKTQTLSIESCRYNCKQTGCFQLFFSFFPKGKIPEKLSDVLWNCSVDHYPSFHHHLACNLETECEDGRDETEHCPFSSADCQGLVALCGRCYKFVESLRGFRSNETDINQRSNDYCNSVGGMLGMPKCVYDWREELVQSTTIHGNRFTSIWLGLYSRDISLPCMYRYTLVGEDKTVLYHSVDSYHCPSSKGRFCHKNQYGRIFGDWCRVKKAYLSDGAVCEIRVNQNHKNWNPSKAISLTSIQYVLHSGQQPMVTCPGGHVIHAFLLCGSHPHNVCGQDHTSACTFAHSMSGPPSGLKPMDLHVVPVPMFTCDDYITTLSFNVVCDFITDCPDKSDEFFCTHPPCIRKFTCSDAQCVSYDMVCNFISNCQDESDERHCETFKHPNMPEVYFPSPALIRFDGSRLFIATPMNSSDPCPESHYRCPGKLNDCLPIYTRCNGMFDCIDYQDEEGCEDVICPGFFRCRSSGICLHGDHLCDGWPHCLMRDDELVCDVICPLGCLCQGHTFRCFQPVSLATLFQVQSLDATGSNLTLSEVSDLAHLIHLVLAKCSLNNVPSMTMLNLRFLDLSGNRLQHINVTSFLDLNNLQTLSLSNNPITSLYTNALTVKEQRELININLSYSALTVFDPQMLSPFSRLQTVDVTFTSIHTISPGGFQSTLQLKELYMEGSPVKTFPADIFQDLSHLHVITTNNYKLCCKDILPHNFDDTFCSAPKDEISSCKDLLQSEMYRGFLWLIGCLSMIGNMFCFLVRLCTRKMTSAKSGYSVFVTNLTTADFLMGVYIAVIGAADQRFRGRYLHYDDTWKHSVACKVAGFLSLLSSEVSALIIWLITLDRFIVLRFPFRTLRFQNMSAAVACLLVWLIGWFLALLPLLPMTSHWEFYSQTGICIPLPVTRQEFKGRVYSFSILICLNFLLFLFISAGQAFVYRSIQKNALKTNTTKTSQDITIARRLITVAVTDFMCWFPIGLCGILAVGGIPIPGEVNVALAIFVLPLNSAINPFMYTFNIVVEKQRKSKEAKLLKWMECHADWIVNQQEA